MSLYIPPDTHEEPETLLEKWRVMVVERRGETTMHFVGRVVGEDGRVSSRIVSFDRESMTGTTHSGRKYRLVGGSGLDPDANYVRGHWLRINDAQEISAATLDELEAFLSADVSRPSA